MTNFFTARRVLVLTGVLLVVALLAVPGKSSLATGVDGSENCLSEDEDGTNELFWESLSRQFSGSAARY